MNDLKEQPSQPQPQQTAQDLTPVVNDEPVTEEVSVDSLIPQEDYRTSPLFYEIANFFGVEESEYAQSKDQLSEIVDWAIKETKSNKVEDLLVKIRELEDRLSPPTWGEKRFKVVYRYLRLLNKRTAFDKALTAFERAGRNG